MIKDYIIYETEGLFYSIESKGVSTFEITPESGNSERGVCFLENGNRYTHLSRHGCYEDILNTLEHEDLHAAIELCRSWELEEEQEKHIESASLIDPRQEHRIIYRMLNPDWYGLYSE